jgi:hypothetical protein
MSNLNLAFPIAAAAILLIYLLNSWLSKNWNPSHLFRGADGRLSTSKFQWWLWIWAIAFVYIAVFAARSLAEGRIADPITDIPDNILWILGISTGTMVASKGLTSSYAANGQISKSPSTTGSASSNLVADDNDAPDLSKLQIFVWTLIAVTIYLAKTISMILAAAGKGPNGDPIAALSTFPDIDSSLLILTGISSTGYIGKKLVTKDNPLLASITPSAAAAGQAQRLIILGSNLGKDLGDGNYLLCLGGQVGLACSLWENNKIELTLPPSFAKGIHLVSVIVNGCKSNELSFELK